MADEGHVPAHPGTGVEQAGIHAGRHAPDHDRLGAGIAGAQKVGGHVGLGRIDVAEIDHLGSVLLERGGGSLGGGDAVAGRVADHRDALHLQHLEAVAAHRVVPLGVGRGDAEGVGVFRRIDQAVDHAGMDVGHLGPGHDRGDGERFARIGRPPDGVDLGLADHLLGGVDRLGRIALRVAGDEFDLAALDPAGAVDRLDGEDDAAVEPDRRGRARAGHRGEPADAQGLALRQGRPGEPEGRRPREAGSIHHERTTVRRHHGVLLPFVSRPARLF